MNRTTEINWCQACKSCEQRAKAVDAICGTTLTKDPQIVTPQIIQSSPPPPRETSMATPVTFLLIGVLLGAIAVYWYIRKQITTSVSKEMDQKAKEIDKGIEKRVEDAVIAGAKNYVFDAYNDFNQNKVVIKVIKTS